MDSVIIRNKRIILRDIAKISGSLSKNLEQKIGKIYIGEAAPPGFMRFIDRYQVVEEVVKPFTKGLSVSITGQKRIKTYTLAKTNKVENYKHYIVSYLKNIIKWQGTDYSITITNKNYEWNSFPQSDTVTLSGLVNPYPRGTVRLLMTIKQKDFQTSIPVLCKIMVQTAVVCVRQTINRKENIGSEQIILQRKDITNFKYTPYHDLKAVFGKIAVRTLTPGTILHDYCLKAKPDIYTGELVYIELEKGNIRLSVPARAREGGCIGDLIWVENLKSHRLLKAKIIKKGIVTVTKGASI